MVLIIGITVNGNVGVALTLKQLGNNVVDLHRVPLAIGGWRISTRDTSSHLVVINTIVVGPGLGIPICGVEVRTRRIPEEGTIDSSSTTK